MSGDSWNNERVTYYLDPTIKKHLLEFVRDRKCQLHYGVNDQGKLASKFFMLHEGNYDRKFSTVHPKYNTIPLGVHVTPSRYMMYPVRAEGEYAVDLVLDIDGQNYDQNHKVVRRIMDYFFKHHLYSFSVWRTRGKHDGVQMKVPFECFVDKPVITMQDIVDIKNFYLKLTWILNNVITRDNIIELKMYNTTFRVPLTFNESTNNYVTYLYREDEVEYLSGEELMQRVEDIYTSSQFYKVMNAQIKLLKVRKRKIVPKSMRVKYNHVDPKDFPSCFKTGMFTMCRDHANQEMIVFAFWCFAKKLGWSDDSIIDYLMNWKSACRVKDDMLPVIKEKHKDRKLGGISCAYVINQAKFCPKKCGKTTPYEGLK